MALSYKVRFAVFSRDGFTCQYCGQRAPSVKLNVDHRMPRSRGGSDDMSNLITACFACNSGKSNTLLPLSLKLLRGPFDGRSIETTTYCPVLWIWQDPRREFVSLPDELTDPTGEGVYRHVKYGPSFIYGDRPGCREAYDRLISFPGTAQRSRLIGGYVAEDLYPFAISPYMCWLRPSELLTQFNFSTEGY